MEIMYSELQTYDRLYFVFVILTDGSIHDTNEVK